MTRNPHWSIHSLPSCQAFQLLSQSHNPVLLHLLSPQQGWTHRFPGLTRESQKTKTQTPSSHYCFLWNHTLSFNSKEHCSWPRIVFSQGLLQVLLYVPFGKMAISVGIQANTCSGFESGHKWPFLSRKSSYSDWHHSLWVAKFTLYYSWCFKANILSTTCAHGYDIKWKEIQTLVNTGEAKKRDWGIFYPVLSSLEGPDFHNDSSQWDIPGIMSYQRRKTLLTTSSFFPAFTFLPF